MDSIPQKHCSRCDQDKPLTDFGKYSRYADGLQRWCKGCWKAYRAATPRYDPTSEPQRCTKCGETKPPSAFQKNRRYRDGLHPWCKDCCHAFVYEDPERRARKMGYNQSRYQSISDQLCTQLRQRYQTDPAIRERERDRVARHRQTPRGRARKAIEHRRRRDKFRGLDLTLTVEQWQDILNEQGNACLACGRSFNDSLPPTRDHIDPAKGLSKNNCQALCGPCNSSKGARYIDYRLGKGD